MDAEVPPDSPLTPGLTKHYEGFLEKKGPRDKDYEKQWIILLGDRMLAYPQRLAQREINTTKPIDSFVINRTTEIKPDSKEKTKLAIKCKEGHYKFKMSTPDERDNWWIRFHALAKMEIPKVHLLPGQIIALQEIIEKTQMNYPTPSSNPTSPNQIKIHSTTTKLPAVSRSPTTKTFVKRQSQEDMDAGLNSQYHFYPEKHLMDFKDDCPIPPTWFFQVTRLQAEELLLNNRESGAILIREGEAHSGFSLSMRQDPPKGNPLAHPTIKHFRFVWEKFTFKLLIEEPQPMMPTMYDLLAFFIEKHGGDIKPMQTRDPSALKQSQHPYECGLKGTRKDPENGEPRHGHETYLEPTRAPPMPPTRPGRQSLPASFNESYKRGEAMGPGNRLHLQTSEQTRNTSTYMVPESSVPTYVNVGRDTLRTIQEGKKDSPPQLPPPRQRCVSSADMESPNLTNKESEYSAPDGTNFVLSKRHSAELKVAVQTARNKQDANRHRSFTSPAIDDNYMFPTSTKCLPDHAEGNLSLPFATKEPVHEKLTRRHSGPVQHIKDPLSGQVVPRAPPRAAPRVAPHAAPRVAPHAAPRVAPHAAPRLVPQHDLQPRGHQRPRRMSEPVIQDNSTAPRELDKVFKKFGIVTEK
ncbi:uncharacterized protein [Asterias amurensis]|uniref:uncharacterized protein isoform X5 n=1 Tax=Asterias amurensis TaxID=7602 RepID=UPI003AB1D14D